MDIAITGSSGFLGTALVEHLGGLGHRIVRVVRRQPTGPDAIYWDVRAGTIDAEGLEGLDAVIHLAGEGIASRRWNESHKARVLSSRVRGTQILAGALAERRDPPKVLVSASGINFYGNDTRGVADEDSPSGDGFLAEVCRRWEEATAAARDAGIRVVTPRNALVLDRHGGIFPFMLLPFRLGLGGKLGSGDQYMSWVTLTDAVRAYTHLLGSDLRGPVNVSSPDPVTNERFTRALGRILRRPTVFTVPSFALRLALGREMAEETVLADLNVRPSRLLEDGFTFEHPDLETGLRAAVDR